MFQNFQMKEVFLCYTYQVANDEYVDTYEMQRRGEKIVSTFIQRFYLDRLGKERTIENLQGRGYLSMEEFCQKYQILSCDIMEEKKEGFMKSLFRKGEKH